MTQPRSAERPEGCNRSLPPLPAGIEAKDLDREARFLELSVTREADDAEARGSLHRRAEGRLDGLLEVLAKVPDRVCPAPLDHELLVGEQLEAVEDDDHRVVENVGGRLLGAATVGVELDREDVAADRIRDLASVGRGCLFLPRIRVGGPGFMLWMLHETPPSSAAGLEVRPTPRLVSGSIGPSRHRRPSRRSLTSRAAAAHHSPRGIRASRSRRAWIGGTLVVRAPRASPTALPSGVFLESRQKDWQFGRPTGPGGRVGGRYARPRAPASGVLREGSDQGPDLLG